MGQLKIREVADRVILALKHSAATRARVSAPEHRGPQRNTLLPRHDGFLARARTLRRRLRSSIDSSVVIRSNRDRDPAS